MIKATFVVDEPYCSNRIFDINNTIINRDNCMYPFYLLKEKFGEIGVDLSTPDINRIDESKFVIYNEMPKVMPTNDKSYVLLFESVLIRPDNWNTANHSRFRKIFTWHDDYINDEKYIKTNYAYQIPDSIPYSDKKKFCTLIAGNKHVKSELELYSERYKAIKWFQKNHPEDFDFYGMGWDQPFSRKIFRPFNRLPKSNIIAAKKYSSYKGKVDRKIDVLKNYKFSICYENVKDVPGYITEKIFDCLFAGCVPVYWGAPNIKEYVPETCFIDREMFESYEELYEYMKNMSESEYEKYTDEIKNFIKSDKIKEFSAEKFCESIVSNIEKDILP